MATSLGWVAWGLSILVALFVGGFLKSYMGKKGENLATKEDIAELTRVQKEIEAKISNEVWQTQKQFEMKKEALFAVMAECSNLEQALWKVINHTKDPIQRTPQLDRKIQLEYEIAEIAFERTALLADVVSGTDLRAALLDLRVTYGVIHQHTLDNAGESQKAELSHLIDAENAFNEAVRAELQVDKPQKG